MGLHTNWICKAVMGFLAKYNNCNWEVPMELQSTTNCIWEVAIVFLANIDLTNCKRKKAVGKKSFVATVKSSILTV